MSTTRAENDLEVTRVRALRRCLQHRHVAVRYQAPDLVETLSENLPSGWASGGDMSADIEERLRLIANAVLDTSTTATTEIELQVDGIRHLHEATCLADRDDDGALLGIVTVIDDVTESREQEIVLENLLREVSHRSKNLLAIVLSIASQTANHAGNIDDFLRKFRGRIHALSQTQDLVTANNWLGASFQSLVQAQLAKGARSSFGAVQLAGDNPTLGPNAALHIGLALHELITNATTHGALAGDSPGRIRLGAMFERDREGHMRLVIDWTEQQRVHRTPLPAARFGTAILKQIVPRSLGGTADFHVDADAVHYRLLVPADQFTV